MSIPTILIIFLNLNANLIKKIQNGLLVNLFSKKLPLSKIVLRSWMFFGYILNTLIFPKTDIIICDKAP